MHQDMKFSENIFLLQKKYSVKNDPLKNIMDT